MVAPGLVRTRHPSGSRLGPAHLVVFYAACLSNITPPVCVSAFAGAAIARADPMQTGFAALKFGSTLVLVPFSFVYVPELLLQGSAAVTPISAASYVVGYRGELRRGLRRAPWRSGGRRPSATRYRSHAAPAATAPASVRNGLTLCRSLSRVHAQRLCAARRHRAAVVGAPNMWALRLSSLIARCQRPARRRPNRGGSSARRVVRRSFVGVVLALLVLGWPPMAQAQEGTLGWTSFDNGATVYYPTPEAACEQWAIWHMGTWLVRIAGKADTNVPTYECWFPHFLEAGNVQNFVDTSLYCEYGYFATLDGCVERPDLVRPSPARADVCVANQASDGWRGENASAANPVMLAQGIKHQVFRDFASGGAKPLVFERTYNGRGHRAGTALGLGWTTSFDRVARWHYPSYWYMSVQREDGTWIEFYEDYLTGTY
jgi:hypothetical protein